MKIVKKNSLFLFFLPVINILFISCGSTSLPDEKETEANPVTSFETVTTVATAVAENKNFEYLIQTNGKVNSLKEQLFTAESGGKLLACHAQTGKRVAAGSMLLQLETTPVQYRIQRAKLTQFNSQKEYESQLLGYENLLTDKSKEQTDDIKKKLRISTGLAQAEQDITEANYELSKAVIKAPFSGVLADVKVQQGQPLKPGEALFKIYDPNNLLLEVKILEADIALLKKGTPAEVSPISNPEFLYKAAVYEINPYVDENGMVTVKLKIENKVAGSPLTYRYSLFPGMNCTATIKVPFAKTLVVPKEAVVMRSGKAVVFILEADKAKWNYVVTGRDNGKEVEIKGGLKQGQKVITTNNLQLAHDAPVKEMNKESNNEGIN